MKVMVPRLEAVRAFEAPSVKLRDRTCRAETSSPTAATAKFFRPTALTRARSGITAAHRHSERVNARKATEGHLRRVLQSYARYYNEMRTHRSLDKDAPLSRPVQRTGSIMSHTLLGGLHHLYVRV